MKTLLLLLLVALGGIAWRSPEIMAALGQARKEPAGLQIVAPSSAHQPMSLHEFAELAKTDPDAYRKLLESMQTPEPRSEVDKLMNFLSSGKYE